MPLKRRNYPVVGCVPPHGNNPQEAMGGVHLPNVKTLIVLCSRDNNCLTAPIGVTFVPTYMGDGLIERNNEAFIMKRFASCVTFN